jgi:hypothetical protein
LAAQLSASPADHRKRLGLASKIPERLRGLMNVEQRTES